MLSGPSSMSTPSTSRTSALPQREVNERFPCLATGTPAPAATKAAAVEILNVVTLPPPVPAGVETDVPAEEGSECREVLERPGLTPEERLLLGKLGYVGD